MLKTNAARILDRSNVEYELRAYEFDPEDLSATTAAAKLGLDARTVFKTLVARTDRREVVLACIPADGQLDGKALGAAADAKKADLVPLAEVQALTGYVRGGCSPLGTKKPYRLFIDESCRSHDRISVSAGLRGLQILVAPGDLARLTGATLAEISH